MQLQKLVYFAHGWYLALTSKPLLKDAVKAWNFGPVIPPLYNRLQRFGNGKVVGFIQTDEPEPTDEYVQKVLRRVWEVYGYMSGSQMSYLTHKAGTPWDVIWRKEKFSVIPDELIRKHFLELKADTDGNGQ